jgi:hypothetical protein
MWTGKSDILVDCQLAARELRSQDITKLGLQTWKVSGWTMMSVDLVFELEGVRMEGGI